MLFRAMPKGDSLSSCFYEFSLADCPVLLTKSTMIMYSQPNSNILNTNTLVRGDEETGIFEGDYIWEEDTLLGIVVYNKGFRLQNLEGELKDLPCGDHIQVMQGTKTSCMFAVNSVNRQKIMFRYKQQFIDFSAFVASKNGLLLLVASNKWVKPSEIKLCTGYGGDGVNQLCFGDLYQAGCITLHEGKVMVKRLDNNYYDIEEELQ